MHTQKRLNLIKKNTNELTKLLSSLSPHISVKKYWVLKNKLIIDNQYKVTIAVTTNLAKHQSLMIELHDNKDYFLRNKFALKTFKNIKPARYNMVAKLLEADPKTLTIIRENLKGNTLIKKINNLDKKKLAYYIHYSANWIAQVHNQKISKQQKYLTNRLNFKLEKKILSLTLNFSKSKKNIKHLLPQITKHLSYILKNYPQKQTVKYACLTHGDYQLANFYYYNNKFKVLDFDTVEINNPARDLGRFLLQWEVVLKQPTKQLSKKFLTEYFKNRENINASDKEKITKDINFFKAVMIQYIILGDVWGKKIPKANYIKKLLNKQANLLKI